MATTLQVKGSDKVLYIKWWWYFIPGKLNREIDAYFEQSEESK